MTRPSSVRWTLAAGVTLAAAAMLTAGCGTGGRASENADRSRGKTLFTASCGSCHTLADAGTRGQVGPNLDDAFAGPRSEGFKESSIREIVRGQILYPVTQPAGIVKVGETEQRATGMPAGLVTGDDADAVAAYVASVAGKTGAGASTQATTTATQATQTETTGGSNDLVAQGRSVFAQAGCGSCHTLKDAGASGTVGPNLDERKPPKALVLDRATNGKGVMPPFKGRLTSAQIEAVATYVSSVAGK